MVSAGGAIAYSRKLFERIMTHVPTSTRMIQKKVSPRLVQGPGYKIVPTMIPCKGQPKRCPWGPFSCAAP